MLPTSLPRSPAWSAPRLASASSLSARSYWDRQSRSAGEEEILDTLYTLDTVISVQT